MVFLKKLHIKILGLAFLVTLISYNTVEARLLPQQFVSECVVGENSVGRCALYAIYGDVKDSSNSGYANFSFQDLLISFNTIQNVDFRIANFNSNILKKARKTKSFSPRIIFCKDLHTAFV